MVSRPGDTQHSYIQSENSGTELDRRNKGIQVSVFLLQSVTGGQWAGMFLLGPFLSWGLGGRVLSAQ